MLTLPVSQPGSIHWVPVKYETKQNEMKTIETKPKIETKRNQRNRTKATKLI